MLTLAGKALPVPILQGGMGTASAWVDGQCAVTAELTFVLTAPQT